MTTCLHRIQVLRFVAAAMVLAGHAQHQVQDAAGIDLSTYRRLGSAAFYASGVDVFFVLSGFIMFAISRADFGRPGAPVDFFARRLARIVPPYWFFTTAMIFAVLLFPGQVSHPQLDANDVLSSYLFIPTRNAWGELYPVLVLGWTLNFEMLFYTVFAIGLRWPLARGLAFIVCVVGALGIAGVLIEPQAAPLAFWCNPIVFEFLFGMLLAQMRASGWRCSPAWGAAILATGVVALWLGSARSGASALWPPRALWMGLPALLICAAAALTREPASVGRIGRALASAGDASYVLYLSHPFTLAAFSLLSRHAGMRDPWVFIGVACVLCVFVSVLMHRWIEKPLVETLNRWIRHNRRTTGRPLAPIVAETKGRT